MPDPVVLSRNDAVDAYYAQKNELDKIWYAINVKALNQLVTDSLQRNQPVNPEDIREEERDQYVQDVRQHGSKRIFSDEEKSLLPPSFNVKNQQVLDKLDKDIDSLRRHQFEQNTTLEDEAKFYRQTGLLSTKVAVQIGKEYYKNLARLPENEPNREEKAYFLTINDVNSKANLTMTAFKSFQQMQDISLTDHSRFYESPLRDPNQLKNMTLDDYLNHAFMSNSEKADYLQQLKKEGLNYTLEDNAYDVLRNRKDRLDEKAHNKLVSDEVLAEEAYKSAHKAHRISRQLHARNLAAATLSAEDRKCFEIGSKLLDQREYQEPKPIRAWAATTGERMIRENRIQRIRENEQELSTILVEKMPIEIAKSPELKGMNRKPGFFASNYDKYLAKHMGSRALSKQTLEQQKAHLARAIAAASQQEGKRDFSTDRIHTWAKHIENTDFFKNMSERQVADALIDRKGLNNLRRDMVKSLYGVPQQNKAAYIQEMKKLQRSMMSKKDTSEKYQALYDSVSAIAKIDPAAPNADVKLMQANQTMLNSIKDYAAGKKSVRFWDSGKERFNNCMDSLAILKKHVPGMKQETQAIQDRVNEVRDVSPDYKDYLDLSQYGAARAENAKALREQKNSPKAVENQL